MAYVRSNQGPGDIAALPPTIGLSRPPTIGSSDPKKPIPNLMAKTRIPQMQGCMGLFGSDNKMVNYGVPIGLGVLAYWYFTK